MVIFPLASDQTIAQMWSNGARGETTPKSETEDTDGNIKLSMR